MLSFQIVDSPALKHGANGKVQLDLTPASEEKVKLINTLVKEGFIVRDLFCFENRFAGRQSSFGAFKIANRGGKINAK